jgi:hypothetical protein
MIKLTRKNRAIGLMSITSGSLRNWERYFLTSFTEGESGEPRLTSKTPFFINLRKTNRYEKYEI